MPLIWISIQSKLCASATEICEGKYPTLLTVHIFNGEFYNWGTIIRDKSYCFQY